MTERPARPYCRVALILVWSACLGEVRAQNEVIGRVAISGVSLRDISDYALEAAEEYGVDKSGVLNAFKFAGRATPEDGGIEQELLPRERGKLFSTTERPFRFREVDYQQILPGETMKSLLETEAHQLEAKEYHVRWEPLPNKIFRATTTAYGERLLLSAGLPPLFAVLTFTVVPAPASVAPAPSATASDETAPSAEQLPFEYLTSAEARQAVDGIWNLPLTFQQAIRREPISPPEE